jgi:hypothetical protein
MRRHRLCQRFFHKTGFSANGTRYVHLRVVEMRVMGVLCILVDVKVDVNSTYTLRLMYPDSRLHNGINIHVS